MNQSESGLQNAALSQSAQNKVQAPLRVIPSRLEQINEQQLGFFNGFLTDLQGVSDRLKQLGYRINPDGHPDQMAKQSDVQNTPPNATLQTLSDVKGLSEQLAVIIDTNNRLLSVLQKEVFPQIYGYLNHIDTNI